MSTDRQSSIEQLVAELHAARVDLASYHKHTAEKLERLISNVNDQSSDIGAIKIWVVVMGIVILVAGVAVGAIVGSTVMNAM